MQWTGVSQRLTPFGWPLRLTLSLLLAVFLVVAVLLLFRPNEGPRDKLLLLAEYLLLFPALILLLCRGQPGRRPAPLPLVPLLCVALGLLLFVGQFVTKRALTGDESSYLFQGRILASGELWAEAPPDILVVGKPLRALFRYHYHVLRDDRWYSVYPPGWPFLLALAYLTPFVWLLNPLLACVYLSIAYRVGCRLFDPVTAALGVAAMALSVLFLHNSSGYLSHPSCAVLLAASFYFCIVARDTGKLTHFVSSVLLLAAAGLVRPYTALCAGVAIGTLLLLQARRSTRALCLRLVIGVAVTLAAVLLYGAYNLSLDGTWLGYRQLQSVHLWVPSAWRLVEHTVVNTRWAIQSVLFFGFPFLVPLAGIAVWKTSGDRYPVLSLATLLLAVAGGHMILNVSSASLYGERYYYEAYFALALLGARGLLLLAGESRWPVALAVTGLVLLSLLHFGVYAQRALRDLRGQVDLRSRALAITRQGSVVFLAGELARQVNFNAARWKEAPVIYVLDPGEALREPVTRVLGRSTYLTVGLP